MKRVAYSFFIVTALFLMFGKLVQAQLTTQTPSSSQSSSPPIPTPTRTFTNPFAYTPLPALNGPENDIAEIQPLTPSRITAG
ncbi:MAG TPA: hypothetical protein VGT05_00340 [Patescibacteria group bacterium]|nr:hypothetical protein [Patescibacteria group bacterium]